MRVIFPPAVIHLAIKLICLFSVALAFHTFEQLRQVPDLLVGGNSTIRQVYGAILQVDGASPQVQAAGTGSMNAVSRFLWRVETAGIPLRVKEMQLGSRKEGADDLTVQLRLSTIYAPGARPAATQMADASGEH